MSDSRLEVLLHTARDPEPDVNGFPARVMAGVRPGRGLRRYVTRPAALGMAAVMIAGAAFAAVRVTTDAEVQTPVAASSLTAGAQADVTVPEAAAPSTQTQARPAAAGETGPTREEQPPPVWRRDGVEYGYTSRHTAYVDDHGVRLETETFTNEANLNAPFRVRLTLENRTDEPIGVYAPNGCALAAYAGRMRDGSDPRADTVVPGRDDGGARVRNCGPEDPRNPEPPPNRDPRFWRLDPGDRLVEFSWIGFMQAGDWAVIGTCECHIRRRPSEPEPKPEPSSEQASPSGRGTVPGVGLSEPPPRENPPPERPYTDRTRMVTPPIRIRVS